MAPTNPVELAKPWAEAFPGRADTTTEEQDRQLLALLDEEVERFKFDGKYFVETNQALSIPASFERDKTVTLSDIPGLSFEGPFTTFSIIRIGRIIGGYPVRSLCLAFEDAVLLPYFDKLPDGHLLHVPVPAIESIERTETTS